MWLTLFQKKLRANNTHNIYGNPTSNLLTKTNKSSLNTKSYMTVIRIQLQFFSSQLLPWQIGRLKILHLIFEYYFSQFFLNMRSGTNVRNLLECYVRRRDQHRGRTEGKHFLKLYESQAEKVKLALSGVPSSLDRVRQAQILFNHNYIVSRLI